MLKGGTEAATEVEYGIIIFQWQISQQVIQFPEAIPDIRRIRFMGFLIGPEQLIQHRSVFRIAGVKAMALRAAPQ